MPHSSSTSDAQSSTYADTKKATKKNLPACVGTGVSKHIDVSDHTLLFRFSRRGSMQALNQLIERHEGALLRLASAIVIDRHRAQEVVQDVFMRCVDKAEQLVEQAEQKSKKDPISVEYASLRTWLCRVTRNLSIDYLRAQKKHAKEIGGDHAEHVVGNENPSEHVGSNEMKAILWQAVEQLAPLERAAIILRYQDALSYREIAQQLGKSINHVGILLHDAHAHLRAQSVLRAEILP